MINFKITLWVTSKCNLACPLCNQNYTMTQNKDYEMSLDELKFFIKSSQDRGLHYYMVDLSGGEVTLWPHLEEGIKLLYDSKVCDKITLTTNGNNPEKIIRMSSMLDYWILSKTQATVEQIKKYEAFPLTYKIYWNDVPHKNPLNFPIEGTLPAVCCCITDAHWIDYNGLLYLRGKIYYCILAFALKEKIGLIEDELVCDFTDDFLSKFKDKKYDKKMCTYCLCNRKIWELI